MESAVDSVRHRRVSEEEIVQDYESSMHFLSHPTDKSFHAALLITLFLIFGACAAGYFLSPISAVAIQGVEDVGFSGAFAINKKLTKGKRISVYAPESMVEDKEGNLYVGLRDGRIVKILPSSDGVIGEGDTENITDGTIAGADDLTDPSMLHGIPLGLRLRKDTIYVMDAIYGLFTINLANRDISILLRPSNTNPSMKFPNDLDITADDTTIYFSDSSSRYPITKLVNELMEGTCTGRLFAYNLVTKKLQTVATELCFANGVQLTKDEKTLLVVETTRYRVLWIDVKTGKTVYVLSLPECDMSIHNPKDALKKFETAYLSKKFDLMTMPDNVRANRHGSYWIGATAKISALYRLLLSCPTLRQVSMGLFSQDILLNTIYDLHHNLILEVNNNGEAIKTLHDPNGELTYALAQAIELTDGRIALGSYAAPYLAITSTSRRN